MLRATLSLLAVVASFAAARPASATEAAQCAPMLDQAAEARTTLEQMEQAWAEATADRAMLAAHADALALEIAELNAAQPTSRKLIALQAERELVLAEIRGADGMIPALRRQVEGLRTALDDAERGYIACIESTI